MVAIQTHVSVRNYAGGSPNRTTRYGPSFVITLYFFSSEEAEVTSGTYSHSLSHFPHVTGECPALAGVLWVFEMQVGKNPRSRVAAHPGPIK